MCRRGACERRGRGGGFDSGATWWWWRGRRREREERSTGGGLCACRGLLTLKPTNLEEAHGSRVDTPPNISIIPACSMHVLGDISMSLMHFRILLIKFWTNLLTQCTTVS